MLDRPYQPRPDDEWADKQVQEALRVLSDHHAREWESARPAREANARNRMAAWLEHAEGCMARALEYAQWADEYDEGDPRRHKYRAESIRQQRIHHHAMQQYHREEAGI